MDLTFTTDAGRFNFRVGAVIIKDGKVLMIQNQNAPYFYSVGGRVQFDESCEEAVKREVREELGIDLEIDRPLFFHQHFFDEQITHEHYHEISVFYLMKNSDALNHIECHSVSGTGSRESAVWIDLSALDSFTIYPEFFRTHLNSLPSFMTVISDKK